MSKSFNGRWWESSSSPFVLDFFVRLDFTLNAFLHYYFYKRLRDCLFTESFKKNYFHIKLDRFFLRKKMIRREWKGSTWMPWKKSLRKFFKQEKVLTINWRIISRKFSPGWYFQTTTKIECTQPQHWAEGFVMLFFECFWSVG